MRVWLIIGLFMISLSAMATDKYARVTGSVNWNAAIWYTDSTFTTTTSVPTSSDNAYICAAGGAGTLTINVNASCASFIASGFSGTIAGAQQLSIFGSIKLSSAMTLTASSLWTIYSSGVVITAGKTITFPLYINATPTDSITIVDNFTSSVSGFQALGLQTGKLNVNNRIINLQNGAMYINGTSVKTLYMSGTTFICGFAQTGIAPNIKIWNVTNVTSNFTLVDNTSSVIYLTKGVIFKGGGKTYNRVEIIPTNNTSLYNGFYDDNTFGDLIIKPSGTSGHSVVFLGNQTVTDTLKIYGTSRAKRNFVRGKSLTDHINLSAGTYDFNYVDFNNIHLTSSTFDASLKDIGNALENTGITFPTPIKRYAVMGSSNTSWSSTAMWSTSSGGSTGASIPIPGDTVVFDANTLSAGSKTLTMDILGVPKIDLSNIDMSLGVSLSPGCILTYDFNTGDNIFTMSGTLWTVGRALTINHNINIGSHSNYCDVTNGTINLSGTTTAKNEILSVYSGTVSVTSDYSCGSIESRASDIGSGTLNLNSYTVRLYGVASSLFNFISAFTLNCGTSTVIIVNNYSIADGNSTIGATRTFYNLEFHGDNNGNYYPVFSDAYNINISGNLTMLPGSRVKLKSGQTYTVTGDIIATGTATEKVYIRASTTSAATISKASGTVCCNYLDIDYSTATGGATFKAGANSTDGTHNSGWSFTSCAGSVYNFLIHGTSF